VTHYFAGLDVSDKSTSICLADAAGTIAWRAVCATDPEILAQTLRKHGLDVVRVVLQTGALSAFLYHGLERGDSYVTVPVQASALGGSGNRVANRAASSRSPSTLSAPSASIASSGTPP
jgi:hypothetical protein